MTKFLEYLVSQTKLCKKIFQQNVIYYGSIYQQKDFHYFLFHKNILYNSEVITLLLTSDIIYRKFFGQFWPGLAQI